VDSLCGDVAKAVDVLDWHPTVSFEELVRLMVEAELEAEGLRAHTPPLGSLETSVT
jgi:GDPmannose 4,6-dehydratase